MVDNRNDRKKSELRTPTRHFPEIRRPHQWPTTNMIRVSPPEGHPREKVQGTPEAPAPQQAPRPSKPSSADTCEANVPTRNQIRSSPLAEPGRTVTRTVWSTIPALRPIDSGSISDYDH